MSELLFYLAFLINMLFIFLQGIQIVFFFPITDLEMHIAILYNEICLHHSHRFKNTKCQVIMSWLPPNQ